MDLALNKKEIIAVSRDSNNILKKKCDHAITGDLQNADQLMKSILEVGRDTITSIIFLQRYRPKASEEYSLDEDQCINIKGPLLISRKAYDECKSLRSIIFISSIIGGGLVADEQKVDYHIVRSGIESMARYLAVEFAKKNVAVNAVRLGYVKGSENSHKNRSYYDMDKLTVPRGYAPDSDEIAKMLLQVSEINSGIITGQIITADAGLTLSTQSRLAVKIMNHLKE